jgi:uncharacterized membrane protein/heat shock protein HslJ
MPVGRALPVLLVSLLATLASGCGALPRGGETAAAAAEPVSVARPRPSVEQLANARYSGILADPIRLTDGRYAGEPYTPGGASRPQVELLREPLAFADLDGDGADEAVALLIAETGGTGSLLYVAVVALERGQPVQRGIARAGDRVRVRSLDLADGRVRLALVAHAADDPACCASRRQMREWALGPGGLTETAALDLGTRSLRDLAGATWVLERLGRERAVPEGVEITAAFEGERVSGSAGCNRYFADLESPAPGELAVGPIGATRRACPSPQAELETRYLAVLAGVTRWSFSAGRLALEWTGPAGADALLFRERVPDAASEVEDAARWRGHLILGDEVRSFTPCGSADELWVVDGTGSELADVYDSLAAEPYEKLFIELRGRREAAPEEGFGSEYAGSLVALELRRAARETRGCAEDLAGVELRARGTEPFWSVEIRANAIRFSQLGEPEPRVFPYASPARFGASRVYVSQAERPGDERIEIDLVERPCVDPMSGERFPFAARVRIGDRTLSGCALEGGS